MNLPPTTDRRTPGPDLTARHNEEETLVADYRGGMTPSQFVEQKLIRMLKASPVMVSQVQQRMKPGPR